MIVKTTFGRERISALNCSLIPLAAIDNVHGKYSQLEAHVRNACYFWIFYQHPPMAEPVNRVREREEQL